MTAIVSLLVVLSLSMLVTRIGSVALQHTGLSREAARFQARSAFTGVGFTTSESEKVVNHPVRRRILLLLMLLGNAGVVAAISSLVLSVVELDRGDPVALSLSVLGGGIVVLWALARSRWVDRILSRCISWMLDRVTTLDVRDYASLLHLSGDYEVQELAVGKDDWCAGYDLGELRLRDEGIVVLGIRRADGGYVGAPHGGSTIEEGDTLLLYGRASALAELDERRRGSGGDREHDQAVTQQEEIERAEREEEQASRRRARAEKEQRARQAHAEETRGET